MCAAEECEEKIGAVEMRTAEERGEEVVAVEMIAAEESWDVGMKVQGKKGKQIA